MNINYLKALNKLTVSVIDIEKSINNTNIESFEDKQACRLFENVLEDMKLVTLKIKYYSKTPIIGVLHELPNGRFDIKGHELTCGSSLEVFQKSSANGFLAG